MDDDKDNLWEQLMDCLVTCSVELGDKSFLPRDLLDKYINEKSVEAQLRLSLPTPGDAPPSAARVIQEAKKIFAILVFAGQPDAIGDVLRDGLRDEHLPLSPGTKGARKRTMVSCCGQRTFQPFKKSNASHATAQFLDNQWLVQGPVVDSSGRHEKLHPQCALPLLPEPKIVGNGQVSQVYKCEVHPAHYQSRKEVPASGAAVKVAVKKFAAEKAFIQEMTNLKKTQALGHPRLIKYLATYHKGKNYYVLFPWADGGTLSEFWKLRDSEPRTRALVLQSLEQMRGLTDALHQLHHLECRHGDLKPDNILHFADTGADVLVIADLGVSRIHNVATGFRRGPTMTTATTATYEGPEVHTSRDSPRSRTYDVWSMGCIFLEYIIWLLYDSEAIEAFRLARDHPDYTFYKPHPDLTAEVHPKVTAALDAARADPRCAGSTALGELLHLVAGGLLVSDVKARKDAKQLHRAVEAIADKANHDPSYLLPDVEPPSARPGIFQRRAGFGPQTAIVSRRTWPTTAPSESPLASLLGWTTDPIRRGESNETAHGETFSPDSDVALSAATTKKAATWTVLLRSRSSVSSSDAAGELSHAATSRFRRYYGPRKDRAQVTLRQWRQRWRGVTKRSVTW